VKCEVIIAMTIHMDVKCEVIIAMTIHMDVKCEVIIAMTIKPTDPQLLRGLICFHSTNISEQCSSDM
jgi:hypothetical protein